MAFKKSFGILIEPAPIGMWLRLYLAVSHLLPLVAPRILRRRLARGREDEVRWGEKLGHPSAARPEGRLIWLHAVGLGEVLALRGMIAALNKQDPNLSFLVTSSARSSAQVFASNLPPRTIHQYLPIDAPAYVDRFLDHWMPDLSVWAEQDIWPGAVIAANRRGIPLALINARMGSRSFAKRRRFKPLYSDLYKRFELVAAQDPLTAAHLSALGAMDVKVTGSLKLATPPLAVDEAELNRMQSALRDRRLWVAASTHADDEAIALAAQAKLWAANNDWLLLLVPRVPSRIVEIALPHCKRSEGTLPGAKDAVLLCDTFGELGLWYRLAKVALVGGSFGPVEGHNPWEPAALGCAILHGQRVANFAADYDALHEAQAARVVTDATLSDALEAPDTANMAIRARKLVDASQAALLPLASDLVRLVRNG